MTRRWLLVAAIVLVVASSVGGLAVAQQDNSTQSETEYTLAELKQDGKHYSVPSARIVPEEQRVYWLEHRPVNQPWTDVTPEKNGPKFDGGVLKTNTVYLRTIRAQTDTVTRNVTIVVWEQDSREIQQGNATTTEQYAANQTVITRSVQLGPGWTVAEIDLPRHSETKRVTMWIESHPDTARWTFQHRSVAFTQPLDADTWSEFVMLAGGFVIIPALVSGAYGGKTVRDWIDRAGAPPGHGIGYYIGVTTIVTLAVVFGAYYYAAEVIVTIPIVLGIYVGVVYIGYMLATHEGRTTEELFWQPHIDSVESFTSTKIPSIGAGEDGESIAFSEDMPFGKMQSYQVLDEGQRGISIVRDGWMAFLARLKGGRAKIENADELRTRFSLFDSEWDEVFIVDPDAEQLIEYEPPGLALKTPEINSWKDLVWPGVLLIGGVALTTRAAAIYGSTVYAVLLVAVPLLVWRFAVEGTDTYCYIDPAPAAMRPVLASMLVMSIGSRDAHSLEDAERFGWKALGAQEDVKVDQLRRGGETSIHQAFSSAAGDASNGDGGATRDSDRPDRRREAATDGVPDDPRADADEPEDPGTDAGVPDDAEDNGTSDDGGDTLDPGSLHTPFEDLDDEEEDVETPEFVKNLEGDDDD